MTADFSGVDRMLYRRHHLRLADGGTLGIDFAPVDATSVKDDAPIIVVQHGLSGGRDSINGRDNKLLTMPLLQAHMRHM